MKNSIMGLRFSKALGLVMVFCGLAGTAITGPAEAKTDLIFGTYAFEKPTETVRKLRPILDALEQELSNRIGNRVKIKLQVAKDYETAIKELVEGRVDFGRYGQAAYVLAKKKQPELQILAVEGDHARKTFRSVVIVRGDSPIRTVRELRGKSFAFGDEISTTGRYLPQAFLLQQGINASALSRIVYLGRHDRVATAIAAGSFDAGAISEWVYKDQVKKGANLRVIGSFSNVTKPWVSRAGLSKEHQQLITDGLIALRGVEVLNYIKKDCFLPGSDKDYEQVRQSMAVNSSFFRPGTPDQSPRIMNIFMNGNSDAGLNPCAVNPCATMNPCAANPCAVNPRGGENVYGGNPCAASK